MNYIQQIQSYAPKSDRETKDQQIILECIRTFPHNILLRDNPIAHITSSGFILNKSLTKTLLIHHNIRNTWAWTGGHADGETDLLAIATREALEETGVHVTPISKEIAGLDVLTVQKHYKNEKYINSHLHLNVAYVFTADENANRVVRPEENSGVEWFPIENITTDSFTEHDVYLYSKLIAQAKAWF